MGLFNRLFFGPPGQDKFARLLLHRFRAANPGCDLVYNREQFQLCSKGERGGVVNLANIYAEYCAAPAARRRQLLANYVAIFATSSHDLPEQFDEVRGRIMPSVRARSYFDFMRLSAELELKKTEPELPIFQPINEHLVCGYVYDDGPSMRFLHQEDLENWGTTIYEVMELARLNFEQQPPMGFSKIGENFYSVLGDDDYGATRLVQDDFLERMEVQGDLVAALPNRGTLMITGTDSLDGLTVMAALLDKEEGPRPITKVLFRRVGDEWEPWLPPAEHPTHNAFKLAAVKSVGGEYHDQKELLERHCQARGDDAFVATYSAQQDRTTGAVASFCAWTKGVRSLLPKTDLIGFIAGGEVVGDLVPWSRVEEVAGDLLVPQGTYPERYLVAAFPSEERLAAIRETV
ncbi:MAG TPA: DUF1444 family protein [Pirellulales bacterium]|nr:DUF1444 family protein [Pirellulales bacterium]